MKFRLNPITRKRLSRFKASKRAWFSFWILIVLYGISLGSELIANGVPLYVRFEDKSYFPVFTFYPEDVFTKSGKLTRPDYKKINRSQAFKKEKNYMIFPPVAFGPYESLDTQSIDIKDQVSVELRPSPVVGSVYIDRDYRILRSTAFDTFVGRKESVIRKKPLTDFVGIPEKLKTAIGNRFENKRAPSLTMTLKDVNGKDARILLPPYRPRDNPPRTVRLTFREAVTKDRENLRIVFDNQLDIEQGEAIFYRLDETSQAVLKKQVEDRFEAPVESYRLKLDGRYYIAEFLKKDVQFPYPPVKGHFMGIDSAGRDVFARVLYGLRTSLTFGLLLVICSMLIGIVAGSIQGYYGGLIDITGQRLVEIWSALPFLYVMILMGSVFGRSFILLLIVYGLFNWIGISYYIRAEFLRLRRQEFVEAAKCMGISSFRIIFRHILPNGLIPVITFFPFQLVGAIGALAALDYLGFGLPPPTPSWGELLFQAQQYRWAWWLILYPSLALFVVMLLGVLIGDGIRNAYDPKQYTRLE